jgi:hypothetical protein
VAGRRTQRSASVLDVTCSGDFAAFARKVLSCSIPAHGQGKLRLLLWLKDTGEQKADLKLDILPHYLGYPAQARQFYCVHGLKYAAKR